MSRRAAYIERQERDSSTFDNTYQVLGSGIGSPGLVIKITNNSTVDVDVSTNGTTDHDFVPAGSFTLYDLRANHGIADDFAFSRGTQFYVKGAVAGAGNVYLVGIADYN